VHPNFLKDVLQTESRIREEAAWALLRTVEELFPEKISELKKLTARLNGMPTEDEVGDAAEEEGARIFEAVRGEVQRWTSENRIACPAVDDAALYLVCGNDGPETGVVLTYTDERERQQWVPSLIAFPHNETRDEFVQRASAYYDEVIRLLESGSTKGAVKRDLDHFRCLVARYVGGHSAAAISRGEVPGLKLTRHLTATTIAGEVRKLADLIGISRSYTPGPRRGSKHQRKRKRHRRA
jgi:hypothetical protein